MSNTQRFVTLLVGVLTVGSLLGGGILFTIKVLLSIQSKWDKTNGALKSIGESVAGNELNHEKDHARMDQRTDRIEGRLNEHIGRHRRG